MISYDIFLGYLECCIGIFVESPLLIWDNLRYPQDKVCCVGLDKNIGR